MTDKDTVLSLEQTLRLALEALSPDPYRSEWAVEEDKCKAITAIKAALSGEAQTRSVVKDEPVGDVTCWTVKGNLKNHEFDYYGNLPDGTHLLYTTPPQRTEQKQQIETLKRCLFQMQEAAKDLVEQAKSLTPPQRKPLTDEQIGDEFVRFQVGGMFTPFLYAVRAIEAAHGIIDPADLKGEA